MPPSCILKHPCACIPLHFAIACQYSTLLLAEKTKVKHMSKLQRCNCAPHRWIVRNPRRSKCCTYIWNGQDMLLLLLLLFCFSLRPVVVLRWYMFFLWPAFESSAFLLWSRKASDAGGVPQSVPLESLHKLQDLAHQSTTDKHRQSIGN